MRKVLILLIGIMIVLLLSSCADNDSDGGSGFPANYQEIVNNYDSDIMIYKIEGFRGYLYIDWYAFAEPTDYSLTIGGYEITEFYWNYTDEEGFQEWYCFFDLLEEELEINADGNFAYEIGFNGKISSGEMHLSPSIEANYPNGYGFDSDLPFTWEVEFLPQLYLLDVYYSYEYELIADYGYNQINVQLSASQTSYVIPQSFCTNPDATLQSIYINLNSVNFSSQNDILLWTYAYQNTVYHGADEYAREQNPHKLKHLLPKSRR